MFNPSQHRCSTKSEMPFKMPLRQLMHTFRQIENQTETDRQAFAFAMRFCALLKFMFTHFWTIFYDLCHETTYIDTCVFFTYFQGSP